ncbi:hirsutellin A toxin [Pochonia chlamydosporia 170]|uniref:Hirsutellin A toxin n=1 Tax=Pochonia chlamydosporia 170 TaxID=1380566 RepID=A0A179FJ94_METCM|nr:hirsutellin A toxin [Pochonia chlamydosporia 170]OAQ65109.1 hirsutellin A toxin [Pochonia chlamydosporia 170]
MKFFATLLTAAALNTPVLAGPVAELVENNLEERAPFVNCRPRLNNAAGPIRNFQVDVAVAQAQARKAGFTTGKSGDPHRYYNGDGLVFNIYNCDKAGAMLWEYPIYWVGKNAEWEKDTKTDRQPGGPTPIRVVYANNNGGIVYCGVMTHSIVTNNNQGQGFFQLCV